MKHPVLVFLALLCASGAATAKESSLYPGLDTFGVEQVSPHVAWGVPLRGGVIKTLFIAPRFTLRDAVELSERLDIKASTAPLWDSDHIGYDTNTEDRFPPECSADAGVERLRTLLSKEFDLIVLGNFDPGILPEDVLTTIIAKVTAGCGLLLANVVTSKAPGLQRFLDPLSSDESGAWVTRGIGESLSPEWALGLSFVTTYAASAGRVVTFDYLGDPPRTHCLLPALSEAARASSEFADTYFSLLAKGARWAAHREPDTQIQRIESMDPAGPAEDEIPPGLPPEFVQAMRDAGVQLACHRYLVHLASPADRTYRVLWQVREPGFPLPFSKPFATTLRKGDTSANIFVFAGPSTFYLDVRLLDRDQVVDWFTEPVHLDGWPDLKDVQYSKSALLPNDTLSLAVNMRPLFHQPRPCTLYARAVDSLGRRIAEAYQVVPIDGGLVRVRLDFVDLIASHVRVELFAVDNVHPPFTEFLLQRSAHAGKGLPVRLPFSPHEFSWLAEGPETIEYNARQYNRTLSQHGVDTIYTPGGRDSGYYLAEAGLRPVPLMSAGATSGSPWWGSPDPAAHPQEAQRIQDAAKSLWGGGSVLYSLGDGSALQPTTAEAAQSALLLTGFRNWLQNEYQEIGRLNAAWGAAFADWDSVVPSGFETVAASKHYAAWVDQRRYFTAETVRIAAFARDAVRMVDNGAMVGCSLRDAAAPETALAQLAAELDLLGVRPDPVLIEKLSDYHRPATYAGLWFGDGLTPPDIEHGRWFPWLAVLHGLPSVWLGEAFGQARDGSPSVALDPFGRPFPAFLAAAQEVPRIKAGIATVLLRATRAPSGIAMYDSPTSAFLNAIDPTYEADTPRTEASFVRLCRDLGYSVDFLSETSLKHGDAEKYRCLILPMARALDRDEIAAIRHFCSEGRYVVADLLPGTHTEHGIPYDTPPLADLFGVRMAPTGEAPAAPTDGAVTLSLGENASSGPQMLPHIQPDSSVQAVDGVASGMAGTTPLWLVRHPESATAVLCNHLVAYPSTDSTDRDAAVRNLFKLLIEQAGCKRPAEIRTKNHEPLPIETMSWRYGAAEVVALLREPEGGNAFEKMRLQFDDGGAIYDLLREKAARRGKTRTVRLARGEAALYCRLPYEVAGLTVMAPKGVAAGRRLPIGLKIHSKGGLPGEHVIRVEIARIPGASLNYYAQNVICPNGAGETYIPLALNETPGHYWITARDVLSGAVAGARIEIMPRPNV